MSTRDYPRVNSNVVIIDADLFVCIEIINLTLSEIFGEWKLDYNWDINSVCTRETLFQLCRRRDHQTTFREWIFMKRALIKLLWFLFSVSFCSMPCTMKANEARKPGLDKIRCLLTRDSAQIMEMNSFTENRRGLLRSTSKLFKGWSQ